jgi:regulator of protease activity HflC (stomatin/prohibitin superfamily)
MLTVIAVLAILYGIVSIIASFIPDLKGKRLPFGKFALLAGVVVLVLNSIFINIGAQEVGVKLTPQGVDNKPLWPGLNIVMPWEKVYEMDKTLWTYTFTSKQQEGQVKGDDAIWAPTAAGIKMGFDISVSWRIDPNEAPWIYSNVSEADGGDNGRYHWIEHNIIRPRTNSSLSSITTLYQPTDIFSEKRSEIQHKVFALLQKELEPVKCILESVDIREISYPKEYEKVLNDVKVAEQKANEQIQLTKSFQENLIQEKIKADIKITQAKGEAEALNQKGAAISNNPKIIALEFIQAWRETGGKVPTVNMGAQGSLFGFPKELLGF